MSVFCNVYGAALTWQDMFTCYIWTIFGGSFEIIAVVIIAAFLLLAYKFHISSTIGLALAWPILLFLWQQSGQTSYMISAMLVIVTLAIGIKVFFAVLARFQK